MTDQVSETPRDEIECPMCGGKGHIVNITDAVNAAIAAGSVTLAPLPERRTIEGEAGSAEALEPMLRRGDALPNGQIVGRDLWDEERGAHPLSRRITQSQGKRARRSTGTGEPFKEGGS